MKIILCVVLSGLAWPGTSHAQVNCFQYPGGVTSCDSPRGNTTITELGKNKGVITTDRETMPYTVTPLPDRSRPLNRTIPPLHRLPTLSTEEPLEESLEDEPRFLPYDQGGYER